VNSVAIVVVVVVVYFVIDSVRKLLVTPSYTDAQRKVGGLSFDSSYLFCIV